MINSTMLQNLDTNNNFNKLKMALLKIGVSVEIVERCACMEHLVRVLQSSDNITVLDNNTITVGDYLIMVGKDGSLDIAGEESITKMRLQKDGYMHITDENAATLVNKHGAVEHIKYAGIDEEESNMFTAQRFMLDNTPYIQAGQSRLTYHIDDGNPTFISSAIRTAYDYNTLTNRYSRLNEWYTSRWGEKFNKKALEIEVDKEVEEERQYFEDMGYDNPDGEGM